jgi:hypothetical protein
MRKLAFQHGEDLQADRPRSRLPRIAAGLILLVAVGPLALEGGSLCVANWKEFMGVSSNVRTPVLDEIQERLHDLSDTFWLEITPWFRRLPWDPKVVLPTGGIVMAIAMLMLRR